MEHLFLGCFAFGLIFTLVSGVLSAAHGDTGGLPAKAVFKQPGAVEGAEAVSKLPPWLPRLNLTATVGFLTWFGGAGWLVMTQLKASPPLAAAAGVLAGWPAYRLINGFYGLLRASETVRREADDRLEGTLARVSVGAGAGDVCEIVFELNGQQRVEGARAVEGHALPAGTSVVITSYEAGLALVHPLDASGEAQVGTSRDALRSPPEPLREPETPAG